MTTNTLPVALMILLISIASPKAQAVTPAPDDGYPGGNTAEGDAALLSLTTGGYNTAVGWSSLRSNTAGALNTGLGAGALFLNSTVAPFGNSNTATGAGALLNNIHGSRNTANGTFTLFHNDWGDANTAIGDGALTANTIGLGNTAIGVEALINNITGINNTAIGQALQNNSTGNSNIAIGYGAGANVATADNVTCIAAEGEDVSNTTWVGNIYGVIPQSPAPAPVLVSADNQLVTAVSSQRFVENVTPVVEGAETLLLLQPVNFRYIGVPAIIPEYGLIAEDVAKVDSNLVLYDNNGQPSMVRYDAVNTRLLNAFIQEHTAAQQRASRIAHLEKQVDALTAGLQKVSAQLELNKSAPQTVLNNQ
jgi:hypothetical protein